MFITLVCVPKMLNFLNLDSRGQRCEKGLDYETRKGDREISAKYFTYPFTVFLSFTSLQKKSIYVKCYLCI